MDRGKVIGRWMPFFLLAALWFAGAAAQTRFDGTGRAMITNPAVKRVIVEGGTLLNLCDDLESVLLVRDAGFIKMTPGDRQRAMSDTAEKYARIKMAYAERFSLGNKAAAHPLDPYWIQVESVLPGLVEDIDRHLQNYGTWNLKPYPVYLVQGTLAGNSAERKIEALRAFTRQKLSKIGILEGA